MITILCTQRHPEQENGVGGDVSRHENKLDDISSSPAGGRTTTRDLSILAHAWPLPATMHSAGVLDGLEVLVVGQQRSNPEAKHSSWLRDRRALDELKAQVGCSCRFCSHQGRGPSTARNLKLIVYDVAESRHTSRVNISNICGWWHTQMPALYRLYFTPLVFRPLLIYLHLASSVAYRVARRIHPTGKNSLCPPFRPVLVTFHSLQFKRLH